MNPFLQSDMENRRRVSSGASSWASPAQRIDEQFVTSNPLYGGTDIEVGEVDMNPGRQVDPPGIPEDLFNGVPMQTQP